MTPSYWQKFALNAENQLKSGSTYVAGVGLGFLILLSQWSGLAAAIDQVPVLKGYGAAIVVLIGIIVAKFRPSGGMSSQLEAALVEIARIKANQVLQSQGINAEIPQSKSAAGLPEVPVSAMISKAAPTTVAVVQSDTKAVPAVIPAVIPAETVSLDVNLSQAPPLPIDGKLLLSLLQEYMKQQVNKPT